MDQNNKLLMSILEYGMFNIAVVDDNLVALFRNELQKVFMSLNQSNIILPTCPVFRFDQNFIEYDSFFGLLQLFL